MEGRRIVDPTRFYQVMMPGSHQKLNLPPLVSKELKLKDQISRIVTLESRTGKWRVSLDRTSGSDLVCLKKGWPQFVERHALTVGEFVFFKLTGDLHFNVTIFGENMCEKQFREEEEEE